MTAGSTSGHGPDLAVVVAAHGSRAEESNEAHRTLVRALEARIGVPATPAFLELADPSIPAALAGAVEAGAGRVVLVPFFLHPGRHLREDVPALVREARVRFPGVTIELLGAFGADPALLDALAGQVTVALGEPTAGHGVVEAES